MNIFRSNSAGRRMQLGSRRQSAIALVITLIMISVIAFMAITFLILSQRERGSVSVAAAQTDARLAAEAALQTATAKLLDPIIESENPFAYDLLVSKNYINPAGYDAANTTPSANVNYDYTTTGTALTVGQQLQNIANLQYDPRPPVFIVTNKATGAADFRYYLDLNRNGRPEPNGLAPIIGPTGQFVDASGLDVTPAYPWPANAVLGNFVGDPEWIGILQRPGQPHSANNPFIARYAFFAVPVGKTLDLNYVHNQANRPTKSGLDALGGDFLRNQGVGSWELNLAAALCDLNTNTYAWGGNNCVYDPLGSGAASGFAFIDAGGLYSYRLNRNLANLQSVNTLFGAAGNTALGGNRIDDYSAGGLLTSGAYAADPDFTRTTQPWPGAGSTNHFFAPQDLFDTTKTAAVGAAPPTHFTDTLLNLGRNNSSYDRHTFYRLFAQLGTDSAADTGKLNLNYRNVDSAGNVVPGMETNFEPWDIPLQFFTNVADRLLQNLAAAPDYQQEFGTRVLRVTNLMVWPTNEYTPAVHRMLQVAANLYDATVTHTPLSGNLAAPVVFRPIFASNGSNIWIAGFTEVTNATSIISTPMRDLQDAADRAALQPTDLAYGVPLVVGAKKGFPGFSTLGLQTAVRVTRKLHLFRPNLTATPNEIRQMYLIGMSNSLNVAAWNSYSSTYPRACRLIAAADVTTVLTNENGVIPTLYGSVSGVASNRFSIGNALTVPANTWTGFDPNYPKSSFRTVLTNFFYSLPNSAWQSAITNPALGFFKLPDNNFNQSGLTPPQWWLNVNTRLRFILVDSATDRILDYVNLSSDAETLDITAGLSHGTDCDASPGFDNSVGGAWCTNTPATYPPYNPVPSYGILNQIGVSRGSIGVNAVWKSFIDDPTTGNNVAKSIAKFSAFMGANPGATNLVMQAPFSPYRTIYQYVSWAINDPLVHYTVADLTDLLGVAKTREWDQNKASPLSAVGTVPEHYRPWGGNPYKAGADTTPATDYQAELKDPLVKNSDQWDFPSGKLPNLGWLGRIHRGTPWQTIYLKSPGVDNDTWRKWSGNTDTYDSILSQPDKDRFIFDLFATTPNPNATHVLPVNQTGLAAWSAVLSGTLLADTNGNAVVAQPAGVSPQVETIVNGIYAWRTNSAFPGLKTAGVGYFTNLAAVLGVPELTVNSPFLGSDGGAVISSGDNTNMTDAVVERIPQQIMSLLRLGDQPRFVIYAYGQALKPADRSVVQTAPFTGMSTNYQITAETAVRAVVRVEGVSATAAKPFQPRVVVESYNVLPPD